MIILVTAQSLLSTCAFIACLRDHICSLRPFRVRTYLPPQQWWFTSPCSVRGILQAAANAVSWEHKECWRQSRVLTPVSDLNSGQFLPLQSSSSLPQNARSELEAGFQPSQIGEC